MQNPPPYPQQNPPNYQSPIPPYSQPLPTQFPAAATLFAAAPSGAALSAVSTLSPQSQDDTTALVLEAVCSVFGLYGIGWLFRGRVGMGIALLALGFVWAGFAICRDIVYSWLCTAVFRSATPALHHRQRDDLNSSLRHP